MPVSNPAHTAPTIGMSILSWRGTASLENALASYTRAKLFNLFDERVIILPNPDDAVRKIAKKYPLKPVEFSQNLGIAGGLKAAAEALKTDYILLLENDCPLIESIAAAKAQIKLSIQALSAGDAFVSRLRSRREPGDLFSSAVKYHRYWNNTLSAKIRCNLRPFKSTRLCGRAVYTVDHPHQRHPNYIRKHSPDTYIVSPKAIQWTNQSILMRRRDFLDRIIPYVQTQPLKRTINGFHNIEIELNRSRFWTQSNFNVLCPPGLFTHKRLEDRGY